MPATAKLRYLRIAPRKVRLVADLIRGKTVKEALSQLEFGLKKAARPLLKLLKGALANAKHNFQLEEDNLYVSKILVDEGPKLKRWRARARGQASEIQKKTSHITIVLEEINKKPKRLKRVERKREIKKVAKIPKVKKPKLRPETEAPRPRIEKGIRRIFRRKAF